MQELNDVVVAGMARSPIGDFMGSLSGIKAVPLAMQVAEEAIRRSGMPKDRIDEVTLGCVYKHGMKGNPARQVQIGLGLPYTGTAVTVEQQCSSSMRALEIAAQQIMLGKTRAALVTGVESMSNVPFMIMDSRKGLKDKTRIEDALYWDALIDVFSGESIIRTAENVAEQYNVTREDQDEYACITQNRAAAAIKEGRFKEEIVPVKVQTRKGEVTVDTDEHPREVTIEGLAKLRPVLKDGTVTAGNASGINDGASAAVICSAALAEELGLKPLVKILATATASCRPEVMGIGPIYAIPKALEYAGLSIDQIDYFEINEAFAAQVLPCLRELGITLDKVNANGSGIALGHPVGMTGLRLMISGYYELKRRGGKYGCGSLCAGGGPAMAVVYEVL